LFKPVKEQPTRPLLFTAGEEKLANVLFTWDEAHFRFPSQNPQRHVKFSIHSQKWHNSDKVAT